MASRAKLKVLAAAANHSYDNELPASGRAETPMMGNYESFPDPSVNNSLLESSMDESQQQRPNKSMDDSIDRSPIPNSRKTARGQVLVHYHPQLGDEGYESTLLERPAPETRSRASRAIATATRGDSGGDGAAGGSNNGGGPPRNIYPGRGMHARAIDHVREEEIYSGRRGAGDNVTATDGNDEYNNAATRQIRRRVLRVALERGIHDERRRKLRDADTDIGGPSLRVDTDDANAGGDAKGGFNDVISPLSSASPREQPTRNGYICLWCGWGRLLASYATRII